MALRSCRVCGGWHDLDEPWPHNCVSHFGDPGKRSDLSAPMLIKDGMDAVQSQVTGRWHESKSALRREYKAHNVIEVGNEKPREHKPERVKVTKAEIAQAVQKVKQGYKPNVSAESVSVKSTGSEWH